MISKYTIEFAPKRSKHALVNHYSTDDPVACEEFIGEILEKGFALFAIKHEGVDLPKQDFERMVKSAAGALASKRICVSLGINPRRRSSGSVSPLEREPESWAPPFVGSVGAKRGPAGKEVHLQRISSLP